MVISIIGYMLLLCGAFASITTIFAKNKIQKYSFFISSIAPFLSIILLIFAFLVSDFTLKNVFLNSSLELPVIYKIAAVWASHEGSIMLWCGLLGLVNYIYISNAQFSDQAKNFGRAFSALIHLLFISFVITTSNPFEVFSFVPAVGMGLNPMLQDMALSIHPPILYLGNVCFAPVFIGTLIILYRPNEVDNILYRSQKILNIAMILLTIGIGLGSWWAYRELGWGGYWFFDPVENISIMPWLIGVALHHFYIIYNRNRLYLKWIIALSIIGFLSIIYGTFIVRSGIITSVHSFAFSPQRGLFIFLICLILTLISVIYFLIRKKYLVEIITQAQTNDKLILIGNIFWLIALGSLVISLIYPIYCFMIWGIDVVIDPDYFHKIFIPIFIPIILLASITPRLDRKWWFKNGILLFLSGLIFIAFRYQITFNLISSCICFSSIFLILQMLDYIMHASNYFKNSISTIKTSVFFSHLGFGMLALAVVLNCNLAQEIEFIGKIGDIKQEHDLSIKLDNIKFSQSNNYYRQIAIFKIEDKNNIIFLKPENRLYKVENSLSQEADIFSFIFYDLYAVISRIEKSLDQHVSNDIVHARIYYQPFISFIWFSIALIALGFMLSRIRDDIKTQ